MATYSQEEQLEIFARVGVTEEAYNLLRKEKRRTKLSMAKIICNLVLNADFNTTKTAQKKA